MPKRPLLDPTEARSSSKEGVVRYVLTISIVLVVVLLAVSYLIH